MGAQSPGPYGREERNASQQTTSKRLAPEFRDKASSDNKSFGGSRPRTPFGAKPAFPSQPRAPKTEPLHRQQANVALATPRKFSSFELYPGLQSALEEKFPGGRTTPIQSLSLGHILTSGHYRAILGAETGSGKTLAYLLPLLHHLKETDSGPGKSGFDKQVAPRALVLSPTHELTRQSTAVAKSFTHSAKLSVMGASSPGSVRNVGPVDVLFATGRSASSLLNIPREESDLPSGRKPEADKPDDDKRRFFRRDEDREPILNLSRLEWLVVDEADVLLGPAFEGETAKVFDKVRAAAPKVNILLVTATLPPSLLRATETQRLLRTEPFDHYLSPGLHRLPKKLETRFVPWSKGGNRMSDIAHEIKRVFADEAMEAKLTTPAMEPKESKESKESALTPAPKKKTRSMAVVFCTSVGKVNATTRLLESKDIPCLEWTGETAARNERPGHNGPLDAFLVQHKREKDTGLPAPEPSVTSPRVLVTTSLLSRGLDFSPNVTTTYLIDPPRNVLDFVHRAGRAGRAGRPGQSQYATELRGVLGKTETRAAVKPGGRSWSGNKEHRARERKYGGKYSKSGGSGSQ
jgi:ATP-dependent RNA helicase MRH4